MAGGRRTSFSCVFTTALLATLLLPEFLSAGPVVQKLKEDVGDTIEHTAVATASSRTRVRNRRNISWYKQHSDFWSWYKYFTDNGNTEAVQELDRVYLSYLQNKNRAESRRSYKAYLGHLGDIYKSCAESEDPNCVASYNRPKPKPAPVKACDPYKDPHCLYALLAKAKMAPVALPAPAPAKAPAPMYVRSSVPVKDPRSGYHYYSPTLQSFLSKEQKAELVRICGAEDVECLQYHLRAAYGYKPSAGPMPSYAHLGCDPKTDPNCKAQLVQKAPSGLYLRYPNCDPLRDPYCAYAASVLAPRAPAPPSPAGSCNPLYEDGCNPLTATKFATPPEEFKEEHRDEPAASMRAATPAPEQRSDPYAMFRDAYASSNGNANGASDPYAMYRQASPQANDPLAMYRQASPQASPQANDPLAMYREVIARAQANDPYAMYRQAAAAAQHRRPPPSPRQQYLAPPQEATQEYLGPRGKTKEGYECFVGYDKECTPLAPSQPRSGANRHTAYPAEAYEPHLNADGSRSGVLEPTDLDCDPEYDSNCRLRRYEPEEAPGTEPDLNAQPDHQGAEDQGDHHSQGAAESHQQQEQYEAEPYQSGQEEPYGAYPPHSQGMPSFVDMLRGYGDQYPEQAPAPMYVRSPVPVKDRRSGYHDYSPAPMSFLSKEQKAELLRICGAEDVECLQYHLRAAYGYKPSTANANRPSDPYAMYRQASPQANDPLAMYRQASPQASPRANDPLAMYRQASPQASPQANDPLAMYRQAIARAQANDPYAMYRQAAAAAQHRRPPPSPRQQYLAPPQEATQEYLGPRGKTKEGYECFVGYDKECTPLAPSQPRSEAYEPHLNADGSRNGVLEPTDLDCDPEYDSNCRLRRYEPEEAPGTEPDFNAQPDHQGAEDQGDHQEQYETEPYQSGQEEPYGAYPPHSQGMPSFVDMLRGYGDQYPEQGDHKAYAADYRKK